MPRVTASSQFVARTAALPASGDAPQLDPQPTVLSAIIALHLTNRHIAYDNASASRRCLSEERNRSIPSPHTPPLSRGGPPPYRRRRFLRFADPLAARSQNTPSTIRKIHPPSIRWFVAFAAHM